MIVEYQGQQAVRGSQGDETIFEASYDLNGNMFRRTSGGSETNFAYDTQNELRSVVTVEDEKASTVSEFDYDFSGRRIRTKNADGTVVLYVSPDYVVEFDASLVPRKSSKYGRGPGGSTMCVARNLVTKAESVTYMSHDHVHSTNIVTDGDGKLLSRIAYEPYGRIVSKESSGEQSVRYTFGDKEFDHSTDLYYFGARYYDPSLGRLITRHNQSGGRLVQPDALNRYAFTLNNPVTFTDPSGHGVGSWVDKHVVKPAERFVEKHAVQIVVVAAIAVTEVTVDVLTEGVATPIEVDIDAVLVGDVVADGAADGVADGVTDTLSDAGSSTMDAESDATTNTAGGSQSTQDAHPDEGAPANGSLPPLRKETRIKLPTTHSRKKGAADVLPRAHRSPRKTVSVRLSNSDRVISFGPTMLIEIK